MPTLPLEPTPENISKAKRFAQKKWAERFHERFPNLARDHPHLVPHDLTDSCKFSSLFAQKLFGGEIRGNYNHQYVRVNDQNIDLNADASDVKELGQSAHEHDTRFIGNPDHRQSMASCLPRVSQWVEEFLKELDGHELGLNEEYEFNPALDDFSPRKMEEPRVLYRSVSLPELDDIFATGEVRGGGNKFNSFEHRSWVFFGDAITDQLMAQGEEVERQASHKLRCREIHHQYRRLVERIEQAVKKTLAILKRNHAELDDNDEYNISEGLRYTFNRLVHQLPHQERHEFVELGTLIADLRIAADQTHEAYADQLEAVGNEIREKNKGLKATSAIIVTKPISGGLHYSEKFGRSAFHTDEYGFHAGQVKEADIAQVIFVKDGKRVASATPERAAQVLTKILGPM